MLLIKLKTYALYYTRQMALIRSPKSEIWDSPVSLCVLQGRMATEFRLIPFWDCRTAGGAQTSASITTSHSEKGLTKPQWSQRHLSRLSWSL